MSYSTLKTLQRREFLRRATALGVAGAAAPLALNLAALGEAAAAGAPQGYKALVCVFLNGGNDYANTVLPYDLPSYQAYQAIRPLLATARERLSPLATLTPLPDGRQLALAPELAPLQRLFESGALGVQLNVGTLMTPTTQAQYLAKSVPLPPKLRSHNDQASLWQSGLPEGAVSGWGGRMGDLFLASNANAHFTAINVSGNAVFMSGQRCLQYQMSSSGPVAYEGLRQAWFGNEACRSALQNLLSAPREHWLEQELSRVSARAIGTVDAVSAALAAAPALHTVFAPDSTRATDLSAQLRMVAQLISARAGLGVSRQVFFVSLGGFDTHDKLASEHPGLLAKLAKAMASFYQATQEMGVAEQVTTFTASEFGRTLSANSNAKVGDGSDHGWGGHQFVMGGAVRGGRIWGRLPEVALRGPEVALSGAKDPGQGVLIPSTAVDQLAATLARWMGVSEGDLPLVAPHISQFTQRDLGYF